MNHYKGSLSLINVLLLLLLLKYHFLDIFPIFSLRPLAVHHAVSSLRGIEINDEPPPFTSEISFGIGCNNLPPETTLDGFFKINRSGDVVFLRRPH